MPSGSKTPEDVELEFRKHYLVTGNVAGSAKAVGLPVSTGYELRNRALDDPEFVEARKRLRDKVEPDAEQMAVCAMQLCMERLNRDPDETIDRLMALAASGGDGRGGGKVSFQDPGPQYAASLAKLFQAVIGGRKFEAEKSGEIKGEREVTIRVMPTAQADGAGD